MRQGQDKQFGRTLWDLIAEYPKSSFFFICSLFVFIGLIISSLVYKKYSFNSPVFSFAPAVPQIIQDTSKKSKLDTITRITEITKASSKQAAPNKQVILLKPHKAPIKSKIVTTNNTNHNTGIVTGQVNLSPTDRGLDLTITNQLIGFLTQKDEPIDITCILGDQESFQFANSIKSFLVSQGYTKVNGVNQALFSQPVIGQFMNRDQAGVKILIGSKKK